MTTRKVVLEIDETHSIKPCTSTFLKEDGHSSEWYSFWGGKCPVCNQDAKFSTKEGEEEVIKYKFVRQKSAIDRAL